MGWALRTIVRAASVGAALAAPLGCELVAGIGDRHLANGESGGGTSSSSATSTSGGAGGTAAAGGSGGGVDPLGGAWPDSKTRTCTDGMAFVTCPTPPGPLHGQDGDVVSPPPAYVLTPEIATEQVTGLAWTRQPVSVPSHDDVAAGCEGLDVGGFSDFRAPTMLELASLVDLDKTAPALDDVAFPGGGVFVWSSELVTEHDLPNEAWGVDLALGTPAHRSIADAGGHRLCVRGDLPEGDLVQISPHLVADPMTGLTWEMQTNPHAAFSWKNALLHCGDLEVDGRSGFRLPSAKEMLSLMRRDVKPPYVHAPLRGNVDLDAYWTSTVKPTDATTARSAILLTGTISQAAIDGITYAVICVRTSGP
ncbi:MAG TPA: DUF1566 domain-containing protein [Minicystis sp.]|nr:DUF1566 domain-containing protein [Minicystis sp.]